MAGLVASCACLATNTPAQEPKKRANDTKKAHFLVLGTFHMANPGHDIFNLKVDDVLTEKRQKEIAETVAALKKFHPTKFAIESDPGGKRVQQYQDYLDGKYTLIRNEIDQLGFRLAKELGHKQIYPIDADGDFPFDKVQEFAKKNGKQKALDEWMAAIPKILEKESEILKNGTISDLLLFMNREQQVREDQEYYMDFAQFADGKEYPGPDLLVEWYRRNAQIFANLRGIIESPEERVLVIYGAGHLYWLQRDVLDSQDLELERFGDFAGSKEGEKKNNTENTEERAQRAQRRSRKRKTKDPGSEGRTPGARSVRAQRCFKPRDRARRDGKWDIRRPERKRCNRRGRLCVTEGFPLLREEWIKPRGQSCAESRGIVDKFSRSKQRRLCLYLARIIPDRGGECQCSARQKPKVESKRNDRPRELFREKV